MTHGSAMTTRGEESIWLEVQRSSSSTWHLGAGQAHVWRIELDDPHCDWDIACGTLSADERRRAESYKQPIDGLRFARTRGVLRLLLGRYCDLAPQRLEWLVSPQGKPALAPGCGSSGMQFNVSHSGEIALVALNRRRVGIDVERLRPGVSCLAVARRYFSPREVAELESLPENDQSSAFFRCWTRKEAFVKATGNGISSGLSGFSVSLLPSVPARLLEGPVGDASLWQLFDLAPAEGYAAALAVEGPPDAGVNCRAWPPHSR